MLVIRIGITKMLVRIASREDPDQTASSSESALFVKAFLQAITVQNFRIFTICQPLTKLSLAHRLNTILFFMLFLARHLLVIC